MPTENIKLTSEDFDKIKRLGVKHDYKKNDLIFSDGDTADYIYFIETGHVYIFIEKFNNKEEICTLGAGDYFGEMAFFSGDRRSASAAALLDSTLLSVDKAAFMNLFETDSQIADRINNIFAKRNDELTLKEHLIGVGNCAEGKEVKIGIKGDPSIRESAFSRERYDSVVDKIISDLQPRLYDLLLNRSVYEIFVHCNSGEVHIRSIFDPFNNEIHPASKLLNIAYIERHFPFMAYEEKSLMVKRLYGFISNDASFNQLPDQFKDNLESNFFCWEPVGQREIARTISKLSLLRNIQNFYLRNFTISMIRDAIRIQFNCDGTHIVSAHGLQEFINENLDEDAECIVPPYEQRIATRRGPMQQMERSAHLSGERRSAPGRRQEDWAVLTCV